VVCRELGFRRALYTTIGGLFEQQTGGPIWVEEAVCTGNESSIFDCDLTYVADHNNVYLCGHVHSAGVICESNKEPGLNGKLYVAYMTREQKPFNLCSHVLGPRHNSDFSLPLVQNVFPLNALHDGMMEIVFKLPSL